MTETSAKWYYTSYQNYALALPDGRIIGTVRGSYRTWYACVPGQSAVEYLTEAQAKAAVEHAVAEPTR